MAKDDKLGINVVSDKNYSNIEPIDKYQFAENSEYDYTHTFTDTLINKNNVDQSKPFAVLYFGDFNGSNRYEKAVVGNDIDPLIEVMKSYDYGEGVLEVYSPQTKLINSFQFYINDNSYSNASVGLTSSATEKEVQEENPETIKEKVEKHLREKQKGKEFQDTEGRIGGSRKEMMAYRMITMLDLEKIEKDEVTAKELVKKERVFPKINLENQRSEGVSSGTLYLKTKLREAFGNTPPNDAMARKVYVGYADYLYKSIVGIISIDEFKKFINTKTLKTAVTEFIKILNPEAAKSIEEEKQERAIRYNQLQEEHSILNEQWWDKRRVEMEKYGASQLSSLPVEVKAELDSLWDAMKAKESERNQYSENYSHIEYDFLVSSGFDVKKYYGGYPSDYQIALQLFEELFGKRFMNFCLLDSSDTGFKILEQANDYEAVTKEESETLIAQRGAYEIEQIEKWKFNLIEVEKLVTKKDHDDFFEKNGIWCYNWGNFTPFHKIYRKKHFCYRDCIGQDMILAYKQRFIESAKKEVTQLEAKLTIVKNKYREREANWDWAFGTTKVIKKRKDEIEINTSPKLGYIKRTGGYKISESDITPNAIREKFGFKEVEFGQSMSDKDSKRHVYNFLAAMTDLADILNIDLSYLNKNYGRLSIAFGSRGRGKFSAHYEAGRRIINITRSRGDGAVAHEFAHYLDNIFCSYEGYMSNFPISKYGTYGTTVDEYSVNQAVFDIMNYIWWRRMPNQPEQSEKPKIKVTIAANDEYLLKIPTQFYNRQELRNVQPSDIDEYLTLYKQANLYTRLIENLKPKDYDMFGAIVMKFGYQTYDIELSTNKSLYYANSSKMSSDYWIRSWELFARAFEVYVFDKLAKAGRANNYLVSGAYFDRAEGVYPQGEERENLFLLFDNLITAIKTAYNIGDFVPFTTERIDEYYAYDDSKKDDDSDVIETGLEVNAETNEVIETVGSVDNLKVKLKELFKLLNEAPMPTTFEKGGLFKHFSKFVTEIK